MSIINKFGESSVKLYKSKSKRCECNFQINRLIMDIEKKYSTYDSELKTIRTDMKILRESVARDIDKDIIGIQKAVDNQVNVSNKEFINNMEKRFSKIEDFIFKYLIQKDAADDVKKRKIEFPKIKVAK